MINAYPICYSLMALIQDNNLMILNTIGVVVYDVAELFENNLDIIKWSYTIIRIKFPLDKKIRKFELWELEYYFIIFYSALNIFELHTEDIL